MSFAIEIPGGDSKEAKTPVAIFLELSALNTATPAKWTAIWADITSGSPPKWTQVSSPLGLHVGPLSLTAVDQVGSPSGAQLLKARMILVAYFLYDQPHYLHFPSFSPTVDIIPYIP